MTTADFRNLPPRYTPTKYPLLIDEALALWPRLFEQAYGRKWQPLHVDQLRALLAYASGNASALDLRRGIYVYGKVGTGKSMLLEPLRHFTQHYWNANYWQAFDCNTVALVRNEEAFAAYVNNKRAAYFDDLGSEPLVVKLYGSELLPMLEVITARYNLWQRTGVPTHFTSNYDLAWIDEHYGTRIASRLGEMCNVIEISGVNLRKSG